MTAADLRLTAEQNRRLHALLDMPWGDLRPAISYLSEFISYLLVITDDIVDLWDDDPDGMFVTVYEDEFSIPVDTVRAEDPAWRFVHVAKVIHGLAFDYGIHTNDGDMWANTPGAILKELDAIAHLNTARQTSTCQDDAGHATGRPVACVGFSTDAARAEREA